MEILRRRIWGKIILLWLLFPGVLWSQSLAPKTAPAPPQPGTPLDTLGRTTPRGTVLGFLNAIKRGNAEAAALYLNTPLRGGDAAVLARQLGIVLDRRLPPRLNEISDKPEGAVPDLLRPDEDLVGTIETADGQLGIMVERVDRGKDGKIWLFSRRTLASIPNVFEELNAPTLEEFLPKFMVENRLAGIPLFEWLAVFVGMPLLYLSTGVLNRALVLGIGAAMRKLTHKDSLPNPRLLRVPVRLLLVAVVIRIALAVVTLPLLARQFWSTVALLIAVVACVWCLLLLTGNVESYLLKHRPLLRASASVLRLGRRLIDGALLFGGFLFILFHFGVDLTAALAGVGVGGIAVALAAQKTLENVIAGVSLIADQALHVGDFINLDDVKGTVEQVGLRSTRIRTLERTVVSLPNGQIANMRLETLSARDKFRFHPLLGLRRETTPVQLQSVLVGIRRFLTQHPAVDPASVRVRFTQIAASSLKVDVSAYVNARDWNGFLEIQEELLFAIIDIVNNAGSGIAFPSRSLYLTLNKSGKDSSLSTEDKQVANDDRDNQPLAVLSHR